MRNQSYYKVVAITTIFLMATLLIAAVLALTASQRAPSAAVPETTVAADADSAPRLWTEKEPEAYVPAPRDAEMWRSVRMPPAHVVEEYLTERGGLPLDDSPRERERVIQEWYQEASKDAYTGPDPKAYQELLQREEALLNGKPAREVVQELPRKAVLGVVVEFAPPSGSESFTRTFPVDPADPSLGCTVITDTFPALSLGDDPPPGAADNFTFYKEDIGPEDYNSVFFDTGPDAGYGVVRQDLGGIDLSGLSLNNYLLEMSRGTYTTTGQVLTMPVTVPHSQEYYGYAVYSEDDEGNCTSPTFSDGRYREYIPDVIEAVIDQYGDAIDWSEFDEDGDQLIDLLVTIHAGYGFQEGGGEDRLSTSSSGFYGTFPQIGGFDTPEDATDDYFVSGFNVDPEQLDLGAVQEEFEHQFGLPDLYVTDGANSNAYWGAHSSGVWGGPLGGTRPVGHNLWQDWVLGWRDPLVIDYDDPRLLNDKWMVDIGRARYTPEDAEDGIIVRLPAEEVTIDNLAGSGIGWWSQSGDLMDNWVERSFSLVTATTPISFSFDAYWDIEEDWDYGFVEVSTDEGATWTTLPDMDGVLTDTDPNGNNLGWGLTGTGDQRLYFDLSAYAGMEIGIRLRYLTDPAVSNPGWWVDNLTLEDDSGVLYENDLEDDFSDWTNQGWLVVPFTEENDIYYLVEWRDNNGFDQSLDNPYYFYWNDDEANENLVSRLPATTPGMLVAIRNTGQDFDYSITDSTLDPPAVGPKFAHLVVDSHYQPYRFDTKFDSFQDGLVGYTMYGRTKSGHAAFGHEMTNEWSAFLGFDLDASAYVSPPLELKTWPSEPGVAEFHDSYGYYPGWYYSDETGFVYLHDEDSSAVIPAKGNYSTRITLPDGTPLEAFYGFTVAGLPLGTGNPGDDHVHYGLHMAVEDASEEQATIALWTDPYDVELEVETAASDLQIGQTDSISVSVSENIGGALETPMIIVELPDNVEYVAGSASSNLMPVSARSAADIAARLASGERLSASQHEEVNFLVWRSEETIRTGEEGPEFGFDYRVTHGGDVAFDVSFYRDGLAESVETKTIETAQDVEAVIWLPFLQN